MAGFVKLYDSITRSSVWLEAAETRLVWITMLVAAGPDGVVEASVGGLAHLARVSKAECRAALDILEAPDADSRSPEHEGRRIEKIPGGWLVLNHAKYRERQTERNAKAAERMRRYRARTEANEARTDANVTRTEANDPHGSHQKQKTEAEDRSRRQKAPPSEALDLSQYLYDAIRSHSPQFMADAKPAATERKLSGWAKDIDYAMRLDGMTPEGGRAAIDAAHRSDDHFWRPNLLSGASLRTNYERLRIKASRSANKHVPGTINFSEAAAAWDAALGMKGPQG